MDKGAHGHAQGDVFTLHGQKTNLLDLFGFPKDWNITKSDQISCSGTWRINLVRIIDIPIACKVGIGVAVKGERRGIRTDDDSVSNRTLQVVANALNRFGMRLLWFN